MPSRSVRNSSHSNAIPASPPTKPITTLTAYCACYPGGRGCMTSWNTRMPPTGSISDPS